MKAKNIFAGTISSGFMLHSVLPLSATTTIHATNKSAYGANLGWQDWRGDTNNGAVIGDFTCAGNIFVSNLGGIRLAGWNTGAFDDFVMPNEFYRNQACQPLHPQKGAEGRTGIAVCNLDTHSPQALSSRSLDGNQTKRGTQTKQKRKML